MFRAIQEDAAPEGALTERESLILQLVVEQGQMAVTQIAAAWPNVSESTISMTISKLWRKGLVSKTTSPENQRVTIVKPTENGRHELETMFKHRSERMQSLFDTIQMTDEERQTLINICQRGVAVLDGLFGIQSGLDQHQKYGTTKTVST
ncbi:MAG: winged helix DNA-binding protein [Planctomycetaceae bacterium]|nr:winged helix DNA-binding protein [Planctomycetaceae bacterium]